MVVLHYVCLASQHLDSHAVRESAKQPRPHSHRVFQHHRMIHDLLGDDWARHKAPAHSTSSTSSGVKLPPDSRPTSGPPRSWIKSRASARTISSLEAGSPSHSSCCRNSAGKRPRRTGVRRRTTSPCKYKASLAAATAATLDIKYSLQRPSKCSTANRWDATRVSDTLPSVTSNSSHADSCSHSASVCHRFASPCCDRASR
ncbi:unnamed protein product [Prorocentrum cordatum]|uniref:Uncharacterized protein n=1 Tax=Prorocentrum cordatum TaxID=2364126 RepID=A0ABN9TC25_9DINO|nr:unnamed protein product [Polarella glacialis]